MAEEPIVVSEYIQKNGVHAITVTTAGERAELERPGRLVDSTEYPKRG